MSVDFFALPTIRLQVLYVLLVLAHERRRILRFGVTAHLTSAWTAQQLREASPGDTAPRCLLRVTVQTLMIVGLEEGESWAPVGVVKLYF